MAQCPVCMNTEPELTPRIDDDVRCLVCNAVFDKAGRLVPQAPVPKKPVPAVKIVAKRK